MTKGILVTTVTWTNTETMIADKTTTLYVISIFLLVHNDRKFVSNFFAAVTVHLLVNKFTKTAYYPKTKGQVESFNRTILLRFDIMLEDIRLGGTSMYSC